MKRYPALPVLFPAAGVVTADARGPFSLDALGLLGLDGAALYKLVQLQLYGLDGFRIHVRTPLIVSNDVTRVSETVSKNIPGYRPVGRGRDPRGAG